MLMLTTWTRLSAIQSTARRNPPALPSILPLALISKMLAALNRAPGSNPPQPLPLAGLPTIIDAMAVP